jgi:CubicO group peptidase (beta-lactamase class C family)
MKRIFLLTSCLFLFAFSNKRTDNSCLKVVPGNSIALIRQSGYSNEVENKIEQFENSFPIYNFQVAGDSNPTLSERMKYYGVKGLSIAVVHDYKIEWAKGYGWADSLEQRPVDTTTLFQACSVSKSINALALMKLAQDKKIDLYTDINNYLTSWKFPYDKISKGKKITTANLLSHTAGLSIHGFSGYANGETIPSIIQTLDGLSPANNKPVRSEFKPGLKFQYSGGGTIISQLILMDVTHEDYAEYMRKNILEPIGMMHSFFTVPPPKEKEKVLATGYFSNGNEVRGKFHNHPQAAAGLWTTPTDICKYIIEMQLSREGKSNKVLNEATTNLMLTPYIDKNSAFGVFVEKKGERNYFQHNGGSVGFRCQYYASLDGGDGVMVMINSSNGGIVEEVVNNIARVYGWKDFYPVKNTIVKAAIINPSETSLYKYVGAYRNGDEFIKIVKRGAELWYQGFEGGGDNMWRIYFTSEKDFFSKESRAEKTFYFDENGNVKGFAKMMEGKPLGNYAKTELITLPDFYLKKYVGKYSMWGITTEVYQKNNVLIMKIEEGYEMEMNFYSNTEFFMYSEEIYKEVFQFYENKKGETEGIIEKNGKVEIKAPKTN